MILFRCSSLLDNRGSTSWRILSALSFNGNWLLSQGKWWALGLGQFLLSCRLINMPKRIFLLKKIKLNGSLHLEVFLDWLMTTSNLNLKLVRHDFDVYFRGTKQIQSLSFALEIDLHLVLLWVRVYKLCKSLVDSIIFHRLVVWNPILKIRNISLQCLKFGILVTHLRK